MPEKREREEAHLGESKLTTDHEEIRRWAEERGGRPAHVGGTGTDEDPGLLRIEFPGYGTERERLEPISWEAFFRKFDEKGLVFSFQERTREGEISRYWKLV
ncbi:MAG: hypothetical protein HY690_04880, partial [Chloroflexi bacterium]|nr:hypothetical protein [Chloroflexota bacterium]